MRQLSRWHVVWRLVALVFAGGLVAGLFVPARWSTWTIAIAAGAVVAGALVARTRIGWPDRLDRWAMLLSELYFGACASAYGLGLAQTLAPAWPGGRASIALVVAVTAAWGLRRAQRWGAPRVSRDVLERADVAAIERARIVERRRAVDIAEGAPTMGLALSGGGVRAASVGVGLLRGLARADLLHHFDYLSTVSGGGWAGVGWLTELSDEGSVREALRGAVDRLDARLGADGGVDYLDLRGDSGKIAFLRRTPLSNRVMGILVTLTLIATAFLLAVALFTVASKVPDESAFTRDWRAFLSAGGALQFMFGGTRLEPFARATHHATDLFVSPMIVMAWPFLLAVVVWLVALPVRRWTRHKTFWRRMLNVVSRLFSYWVVAGIAALWLQGRAFGPLLALGAVLSLLGLMLLGAYRFPVPTGVARRWLWLGMTLAWTGLFEWAEFVVPPIVRVVEGFTDWWYALLVAALTWFADGRVSVPSIVTLVVVGASALTLSAVLLKRNRLALLPWWEQRIATKFIAREKAELALDAYAPRVGAPLHVIQASVNSPRWDQEHWAVGVGAFELTSWAVGGDQVGFTRVADGRDDIRALTLQRAIGISAAALTAQAGETISPGLRGALALFNLQLGWWIRSPRWRDQPPLTLGSAFSLLGREMFGTNTYDDELVFLSDGGHYENLGIVGLVERGCSLVVGVDAGEDRHYLMLDAWRALTLCFERGWRLESGRAGGVFPAKTSVPWGERLTADPLLEATLVRGEQRCRIILFKAALSRSWADAVAEALRVQAQASPELPQHSTLDQAFTAELYGLYSEVGDRLVTDAVRSVKAAIDATRPP